MARFEPEILRADANRYHAIYGDYGVSVFAARDLPVDELAQQVPLVRFGVLTLARAGTLRVAGFRLAPTVCNPSRFTAAFDEFDAGVASLVACGH